MNMKSLEEHFAKDLSQHPGWPSNAKEIYMEGALAAMTAMTAHAPQGPGHNGQLLLRALREVHRQAARVLGLPMSDEH